jgi:polysaccharide biosynthesis transport protein
MNLSTPDDRRSGLVRVIRRRAWIVVLCAVLAGGAAYLVANSEHKKYTAGASLLFQQQQLGQQLFGYSVSGQVNDPGVVEATNVELASAPTVAAATAASIKMPVDAVTKAIDVVPAGSSQLVSVNATADDPQLAARLANVYAQSVVSSRRAAQRQLVEQAASRVRTQLRDLLRTSPSSPQVGQVKARLSQLNVLAALQTGDVQLSNAAKAPTAPSGPRVHRDAGLGVLIGLIIGLGVVFALERVDRRVRDEDELAALYGATTLAHVPRSKALSNRAGSSKPPIADAAAAEAFRLLRARLRYFNVDKKLQMLLVTSAVPQEGKSTVAWQLAWTSAATAPDEPVLLIEADLRRPSIAATTGLSHHPGLSDALTQLSDWRDAVQSVRTGPGASGLLHVITAGGTPPNPTQLIESDRLRGLLTEAREEYAFVVVDAPPALIVSDALALINEVDGVVIVGRVNQTHRDAIKGLRTTLTELNAPVLGVVANGVTSTTGRYGYGPYEASTAPDLPERPRSLSSP